MTPLNDLPFPLPAALLSTLAQAYATPPRAYHNLQHVQEVVDAYRSVPHWQDPGSVLLAVLFHDAVYQAGRSDNEAESARMASGALLQTPPSCPFSLARVEALILMTARHGSFAPEALDHDEAHFLDCDMAILGAPRARFEAYEAAIALEYAHVPSAAYRAGRARFLGKLLASSHIYLSLTWRQRLEAQARANLQWALAAL